MSMSLNLSTNSLSNKVFWSAAASIVNLIGRLLAQILIARMLGPEGLGRIAYYIWLIEIANVLSCFGLPSTLTRYMAELHGHKDKELATCFAQWVFLRYLLFSMIGLTIGVIIFLRSSQYVGTESIILPILILLFIVSGLKMINQAYLTGQQRFDLLAYINVLSTIAMLIGVAVGGYLFGVVGVVCGYVISSSIQATYSFTILHGFPVSKKLDPILRKRVWKFTFNTWLAMIVSALVWSRAEIYFIERYFGAYSVAMFTIGLTFAGIIQQAAALFGGAFMPHFSQFVGDGNKELIQRQFEAATSLAAFFIMPLALGTAGIMPILLPLLFGNEFLSAVPNSIVLTATAALAFSTIGSSLVYAKERSDFIAYGGFVGAVFSLLAGFLVISRFGVSGAVWTRLVIQSAMVILGAWFIASQLKFSYPFKSLGRTLMAALLSGLSAWLVVGIVISSWVALPISVTTGAIVYFLAVKCLTVLGEEEVCQLKRIADRLPKPFTSLAHRIIKFIASK